MSESPSSNATAGGLKTRIDRSVEVGKKIRDAQAGHPVVLQLETSQRIIARITDGIYREPWAAFRELAANAYDADANRVVIETGLPNFEKVVIRDDGAGMTPETLAYVVENIGGSSKRTVAGEQLGTTSHDDASVSPKGRKLIGKIGIGLFAVAQLTQHFQIISKAKGDRFRSSATVLLSTHHEGKLETQAASDQPYRAGVVHIVREVVPESEIDAHGTTIVLHTLRPEIRRLLQSVPRWRASTETGPHGSPIRPPPIYHIGQVAEDSAGWQVTPNLPWSSEDPPGERFSKLVAAASDISTKLSKLSNLEHLDEYLQSIWKLSLSLPLPYIAQHPFDFDGASGIKFFDVPSGTGQAQPISLPKNERIREKLQLQSGSPDAAGGFEVIVDGVQLKRPITLPTTLRKNSRVGAPVMMVAKEKAPFSADAIERAGGALEFEAYLYWNSKIQPKDTAGVLVRVREASGTLFDPGFLKYQVSEQNRLGQITAEIFVTNGLDAAINIDRESFNFSHPHFLYIQRWLHRALRLLANRLKAIADEDLGRERAQQSAAKSVGVQKEALEVWSKRRGESEDAPVELIVGARPLPTDIAGVELDWTVNDLGGGGDGELATAVGIVLESYGVLSTLDAKDRAQLIEDLLRIFRMQQSS